jgi:phospholipid transport system substrate-binding protein
MCQDDGQLPHSEDLEHTAMIRERTSAVPLIMLLLWCTAIESVIAATPPPADPMTVIKVGLDQVIAVFNDRQMPLNERREKLRSMSLRYFDFDNMAKSALGYHWRDLTPAQRSQFVPLFTEFIQDAYLSKMEQATVEKIRQEAKNANVRFLKQSYFDSDYAEVFTTVALQDQPNPAQVNYLMHQNDGQWQVYDVTIDAISLIANYRNQFDRIINNQGYPKLISKLQTKRDQLRQYMDQEARNSTSH